MTPLEHESTPPPHLKRRVLNTLRERGLIERRFPAGRAGLLAAALALLLVGAGAGRLSAPAPPAPAEGPRWLLLLYEDSAFAPRAPVADLVAEYRAWARGLRQRGSLVAGEKLGEEATLLAAGMAPVEPGAGPLGQVTGLFIVVAGSEAEALSIAWSCPHLRHGGRVLLRPIEAT